MLGSKDSFGGRMPLTEKIVTVEEAASISRKAKDNGGKIVHCHGVFDLLHVGHLRHFDQAKALGDVLIVTITADDHVNKGPHRPAFTQVLRAEAISSLEQVDYVAINYTPTATFPIKQIYSVYFHYILPFFIDFL